MNDPYDQHERDPYERRPEPMPDGFDPPEEPELAPEPVYEPAPRASAPPAPAGVRATRILCPHCGYNLTGVAIGSNCPECGAIVEPSLTHHHLPQSGMAITSMVMGICSIAFGLMGACCFSGVVTVPLSALGLVFWHLARGPIREGTVSSGSAGMNMAGLICNIIGLLIGLGSVVLLTVAIVVDPP